jgi:hypothetical protein
MGLHLNQRGEELSHYLGAVQTLENTVMDQEMKHPMTVVEEERWKTGTPRETIVVERIWNKRPDGLTIKMPTPGKLGELVILKFKRMSDVTHQYFKLAKRVAVVQYVSIKSVLEQTLVRQGWLVSQRLHENLAYFKVPHQTWSPEGQS